MSKVPAPIDIGQTEEADLHVIVERWTPRQNRNLRKLVGELQEAGEYKRSKLMVHWKREHTVSNTWEALSKRLEDLNLPWPADWDLVEVAMVKKVDDDDEVMVIQEKMRQPTQQQQQAGSAGDSASGLNARGQMRWTQKAVSDLLACHKLGLEAKTGCPDRRLAELVHREFLQRHPYCPIAPNVLLTKCYILRSELKSGKLVLTQEKEDTGEKYRGATGLRSWTTPMLQELLDSRRRAIHRRKMGGGNTAVLGDIWLEEFRAVYPDYRSSKKNLFRKFKWWRSKRQEERREGGARERRTISQELYQEVRALLESSQVILPPFVSSKVIMLGQQWVESGNQSSSAEEATPDAVSQLPESNTSNTITLPGGAVLVARPATNAQAHSPRPAVPQEAPNVSITLGTKAKTNSAAPLLTNGATTTATAATPPARVVASLTALGLPLACLPTLLAVYREVRDTYKSLVMSDYLVSWTQLVTARLRSTGLASSPSALLSCERLDALVQLLLEETVGRANMKTVVRPSPAVPCSPELLQALQDNLAAAGGCIQMGWRKWILEKPGVLSARQFVSLCELLSPRARGGGWEEIAMEAELAEVWLLLGRHAEVKVGEGLGTRKRRRKVEEGVTLDMVDRWWRKTKHLPVRSSLRRTSKKVILSKRQHEAVRRAGTRAFVRWRRQEGSRRLGLKQLLQKEWTNERQGPLSGKELVAILCSIGRREKMEVAKKEDEEMREQRQDYLDYLETEVEVIEEKMKMKVEAEEQKLQDGDNEEEGEVVDYNNDEAVLDYIRDKERNKRGISSQVRFCFKFI